MNLLINIKIKLFILIIKLFKFSHKIQKNLQFLVLIGVNKILISDNNLQIFLQLNLNNFNLFNTIQFQVFYLNFFQTTKINREYKLMIIKYKVQYIIEI